jgi:hypothetical protein
MSPRFSAVVIARNEEAYRFETEAKRWEAARYPRGGDATVRRLGSFPRLAAALTGHGLRRLWVRRSVR